MFSPEDAGTIYNADGTVTMFKGAFEKTVPRDELKAEMLSFFADVRSPVPSSVSARQARLALLGAGLLANAEQALAAMEGVQGEAARIEWEYASAIERDSPLVLALSQVLGLTGEQVDDLFRAAEGL